MIPQTDLISFNVLPDGGIEATLQRMGRLVIKLPNSAQSLEICVRRDPKKSFRCFVVSSLTGDERQNETARKANGGVTPEITHILGVDGRLNPVTSHEKTKPKSNPPKNNPAASGESKSESGAGGNSEPGAGGGNNSEPGGDENGGEHPAAGGTSGGEGEPAVAGNEGEADE